MADDDVCACGHVRDEHTRTACLVPHCDCIHFELAADEGDDSEKEL